MSRIIIIGGGVSGKLLGLNLLRRAPVHRPVSVRIIDREGEEYMGPAYSNESPVLLLNVPAEQMGAFSEDPEHFCKWVRNRGRDVDPGDFLPRELLRKYIHSLLHKAIRARADNMDFEQIRGEVTDVELKDSAASSATVHLKSGKTYTADKVVLALGNFPPRQLSIDHLSAYQSERYIRDPWDTDALDPLSREDRVFFIGTGQTMVDLTRMLCQRGHRGSITAISRRGLLPMAHRNSKKYPSFFKEIQGSDSIAHIFATVRTHVDRARKMGMDDRAVIDSMRADTQELWSNLPEAEKRRFMRHVFRYWERIRSRIPPQNEKIIEELRDAGQLQVLAGRIYDLVDTGDEIEVQYHPRRSSKRETVSTDFVINCIGPETDYRKVEHPLMMNLLKRGLVRPGPAYLGMDALLNGAVVNKTGEASEVLYTLGSTMKGLVWEVLAVPDIRVQAEKLAGLLLKS
ncbi:MAG TPA: FAD/NAD(P)-binding protein [Balneolaceae bacterium]|nr:FAD/NAD(P)-binding protein [Balneolaceae bacterium]